MNEPFKYRYKYRYNTINSKILSPRPHPPILILRNGWVARRIVWFIRAHG